MNIHPFAPANNTTGYREMLTPLEAHLVSCTGFDACSLQPTSGASDEYAGLLVIRKYQESIGQGHRNVCIIPRSAHGTNPASAVMCGMKIKWIDDSQKENRPKGLVIVDIELVAVKSCKGPGSSGWNGWQSIVMETEYGDSWVDKADENRQRLETYDAMRKTTESEREAKDQNTEHNKYARNGGRRYCQVLTWFSKIEPSTDPKVETEILSMKMHQMKAIIWNQVKSGDDAAERFVSNDAKKTLAEATQLLENILEQSSKSFLIYETLKTKPQMRKKVHQVREELFQELSKENGKDNDELRNFAAKFDKLDVAARLQQSTRSLQTAQLESRAAEEAKNAEAAKSGLAKPHDDAWGTLRLSDQCSNQ